MINKVIICKQREDKRVPEAARHMSLSNSSHSSGSDSVRSSVFREFSLLLKRHNSDMKVKTLEEHKEWLDHLDSETDAKRRRKAILNITDNIDKYEKSEIPLIWVKATSLLKRDVDNTESRMLLELLSKCCLHCGNEHSVRLMFYFTLIDFCCVMGDKITLNRASFDTSLDLIFNGIDGLTHQGTDIVIFEQHATMNISQLLSISLSDILNFNTRTCISFLSFLNNCLRNSTLTVDGLGMIIHCAQKTPSPEVLLCCFHTINILISTEHEDISDQSTYDLAYLITGAINLDNKFNQQLLKTLDALIESKYWDQFAYQLKILMESPDTNYLNLRGAVTILTDFALQDKENWFVWLTKIFERGNTMYGQILECIKTLITDDHFCEQGHGYVWYNEENMCLLKMLREILSVDVIRDNNPITIASIYNALFQALLSKKWELYGLKNSSDLLALVIEHEELLSKEQISIIAQYLESYRDPLPQSSLTKILHMLDATDERTAAIVKYFANSYALFDSACKKLIEKSVLELLSCDESQSVFASCTEFLVFLSEYIPTDTLRSYVEAYLVPKQPRRKSIVSIGTDPNKIKWKLTEQSIALVRLFQRKVFMFPYLILTWRCCIKAKDTVALLVLARILMKMRIDADGLFYFCKETDIDGLTATLNRNTIIKPEGIDGSYLWKYPEDETTSYLDKGTLGKKFDADCLAYIDISEWTELLVETLRKPLDWELYTYLLSHLCPQLANYHLFKNDRHNIEILHDLILHQLKDGCPIKMGVGINKSDVQLAFVRTLSSLFPYYGFLGKSKADEMIKISLGVLESSFEKTIVPLLHNFSVSCYEIPSSIKKHLNPLLETISIRLTKKQAIPCLLEFLIALSDSPQIISPLTIDQLKRVFTIAFKLIEVSHDLKEEAEEADFVRHSFTDEQEASFNPSTSNFTVTKQMAHFYLTLSYQIISHWFIRISLSKRPLIAPFLMVKLSTLKRCDDTEAYKDLVTRFTTTDLELRVETVTSDTPNSGDPHYLHEYWYRDGKILSIEVNTTTGSSLVVTRGASGNSIFNVDPIVKKEPDSFDLFQFGKNTKPASANMFTPGYVLAQFSAEDAYEDMVRIEEPHLIKSIQLIDTIPVVEFHKIGLLYMAPNDTTEKDILSHSMEDGSHQYKWFVNELGSIIKLEQNETFYIGGLNPGTDGEYALIWHDQKCQIVFHTVSLMPNDDKTDPDRTMKKRHVGNNFINIYYDERKQDSFPFDIIKSQFNFINLVIKPMWNGKDEKDSVSEFYKVKIYRAKEVPGIFSTSHFKIMHKQRLAAYVRHLSTVANTFAQIWHESVSSEHCSTWSRRFAHIKTIKTRLKNQSSGAS
ncbi:hypothetical protein KDRO_A07550 [Kluyveromyces lactis]|nr:hypothetical protein KDRO_A07550 [Kluyveromyces lactis]